jgi:gluconate 2-dehydrogenase gamma chain
VDCAAAERTAMLDDIAWPERAADKPALSQGVSFFSSFRDLTASGFWSSKMGIDDLKYMGNVANPDWQGCPTEALAHLGLKEA